MSSSIRSIKRIERSIAYSSVQAIRPYAYYPYRDGETQQTSDYNTNWKSLFQQAANSAASWLQEVQQAKEGINQLCWKLSSELHTDKPLTDSVKPLTSILNHLENRFKEHVNYLKPELWESVELALRHPAAEEIGLRRSIQDGMWTVDGNSYLRSQSNARSRIQRLLLGADGMLTDIKDALSYSEHHKAALLLQPSLTSTLPYAAYHSSMQTYSSIPYVGLMINRYL